MSAQETPLIRGNAVTYTNSSKNNPFSSGRKPLVLLVILIVLIAATIVGFKLIGDKNQGTLKYSSCNLSCNSDSDCPPDLYCNTNSSGGECRSKQCPSNDSCICDSNQKSEEVSQTDSPYFASEEIVLPEATVGTSYSFSVQGLSSSESTPLDMDISGLPDELDYRCTESSKQITCVISGIPETSDEYLIQFSLSNNISTITTNSELVVKE